MTDDLAGISGAQMREVDRLMIEKYGITLLQMMENAGRSLAELARFLLANTVAGKRIVALVGPGNNGGGGLCAARHLANAGATVVVALAGQPPLPNEAPEHQRRILAHIGVASVEQATPTAALPSLLAGADLILDALLGYSGHGAPREPIAIFIRAANMASALRLALDLPSGLDADLGLPAEPTLNATATLTLAWPKLGLLAATARPAVGDLYLSDISVPSPVYRAVGVEPGTLFASGPIVRIHPTAGGWRPGGAL